MKTLLFHLALLVVVLAGSQQTFASHAVGSDLSYECVPGSPGTYRIRLVIYRDCSGIPMCSGGCGAQCSRTVQVMGADASCNGTSFANITLNLINVRDVALNPNCPNSKNTCTNMGCVAPGTFTPSVERYEFTGLIDLNTLSIPASCCNIRFMWQECCRNTDITTGASGQNYYMEALMNRCLAANPCNNSPQFTNDPYVYVCKGQPFYFNNGVTDPESDSLSFAFTPPLISSGTSVNFISPYSYDKPMPWTGPATGVFPAGISCDPFTGDIAFTPPSNVQEVGVMGVAITQWKTTGGVPTIMSVTRRDIQMATISCPPNNPPLLATVPAGPGNYPKTTLDVCANSQICFDIIVKDSNFNPPAISDTTYLTWNSALVALGATFTPNYNPATRSTQGPREDSYKFCWTPDDSLARQYPYYFTVTGKDNKCPVQGSVSRSFGIVVRPLPAAILHKTNYGCGLWSFSYSIPTHKQHILISSRLYSISKEPGDYTFSNGAYTYQSPTTPAIQFTKPGKYLVKFVIQSPGPISQSPCEVAYYDTITVDTPYIRALVPVIAGDTNVKNHDDTVYYSTGKQPGFTYQWTVTNGIIISGQGTDSVRVKWLTRGPGSIEVVLGNAGSCGASSTLPVFIGNVGLPLFSTKLPVTIYPNPAKNTISIRSAEMLDEAEITIFDMAGKNLLSKTITEKSFSFEMNIDFLKPGAYLLNIRKNGSGSHIKLMKE